MLLISVFSFFVYHQINYFYNVAFAQQPSSVDLPSKELLPLPQETNLFFVSVNQPSLFAATAPDSDTKRPLENIQKIYEWMPTDQANQPSESSVSHDSMFVADELFPSPDGTTVALQVYYGIDPVIWLLDLKNREKPTIKLLAEVGLTRFLGWHPNGEQVLARVSSVGVPDPGLWLVSIVDGRHQRIEIPDLVAPAGLLTAAFSPDGQQLFYATSKGIGFGSELWSVNANGEERRLLWKNDVTTVSNIMLSPNGWRTWTKATLESR